MTILSTNFDLDKCIEAYTDRRYGLFVSEDSKVFSIRLFTITSINTETDLEDPNDPNSKKIVTKFIGFQEYEQEYEYWYSKYGVKYDKSDLSSSQYVYSKLTNFDMSEPYDSVINKLLQESCMASDDRYKEYIEEALNYAYAESNSLEVVDI